VKNSQKNNNNSREYIKYLVYSGHFLRAINEKHHGESVKRFALSAGVNPMRISTLRNLSEEEAGMYKYSIKDVNSIIRKYILHSAFLQKITEDKVKILDRSYPEGQVYKFDFEIATNILQIKVPDPELKNDNQISRIFIGYVRNISKQYIDLVSLTFSFGSGDITEGGLAAKGTCEYRFYSQRSYHDNHVSDKNKKSPYISQFGSFKYVGENLTALVNADTATALFETYLSIHAVGFLTIPDDEVVLTGFYTTIFSDHSPGRGLIMLEQKENIEAVEALVDKIFAERFDANVNDQHSNILKRFYKDTYIKPVIQHALYKYTPIITDKETIKELPGKDKLVTAIAPRIEKGFDGYYQFHYLDVNRKELISNIIYIDKSGKCYMYTFQKYFYFGFFQIPEKRAYVATLHFDYLPHNRIYRVNIVISTFNLYDDNLGYLYGVYSAIEYGNDLPVCGRMRLSKLNCDSLAEAEKKCAIGTTGFDLKVLKNKTADIQEGADHDLWMFLEGKWPPNGAFGESMFFYEKLLKEQGVDIISGNLMN
jgi:hypothetical protein